MQKLSMFLLIFKFDKNVDNLKNGLFVYDIAHLLNVAKFAIIGSIYPT